MLTYAQALQAIFDRTNYERTTDIPYPERVWRLSRMEKLLEQLGNPHRAYPSVHVAGTKGKGSVTAMIESVLRQAGYRTGMYISPHLHTFRERICAEGQLIPEEDLASLVERMIPILQERPEVTVFEMITAMAMWYFAEREIEFGVFEVGMGGRLDATNVLRPTVAVITSISLDHTKVLGETIEAIAREKAGIIKAGIPTVAAPQAPEAMQVISDTCHQRGSPLVAAGRDWRWRFLGADYRRQRATIYRDGHEDAPEYPDLEIPLLGAHQLENACTAVAAIHVLEEQGVSVGDGALRRGLREVQWPGRMEILGTRPLVVVDGAHNPYSAQRLLESLAKYLTYRRIHLIFGSGRTHDPQGQLTVLLPNVHATYFTEVYYAKATPAEELQATASAAGHEAYAVGSVREALRLALDAAEEDDLILVTGSLFLVAEAREAWAEIKGHPLPPSDPPEVHWH